VAIVAKGEGKAPDPPGPAPTIELVTGHEADDVVRLGDEHVNGVESLCVGESQ